MNKVYCDNCKWGKDNSPLYKNQYCNYVLFKMKDYRGEQTKRSTINYLNKDNDCPYYKRKWWKFWVK